MVNFAKGENENFKCQIFDWNATFLIHLKEAKTVFQYLVWFAPQNRANNRHMGKTLGDP